MTEFLRNLLHQKHLKIAEDIDEFDDATLVKYSDEYDKIIELATKEYQTDYDKNAYKDEERRLIIRLGDYKENHLLFMHEFSVPFTNNIAESDIRPVKRKLNTGIFRSEIGAESYLKIRSFISKFQKQGIDIFNSIIDSFKNKVLTLSI